jgi:bacillolysin
MNHAIKSRSHFSIRVTRMIALVLLALLLHRQTTLAFTTSADNGRAGLRDSAPSISVMSINEDDSLVSDAPFNGPSVTFSGPITPTRDSPIADNDGSEQTILGGQSASIVRHDATGVASFIRFPAGHELQLNTHPATRQADSADLFLAAYGSLFGIQNRDGELELESRVQDQYGFTHTSYSQVYRGIPVFGGILNVHANRSGAISAANGIFVPDITVSITPGLSADAVGQQAITATLERWSAGQTSSITGEVLASPIQLDVDDLIIASSELVIYRQGLAQGIQGPSLLTYAFEITGPNVREFIFVDAHKGVVLDQWSGIHSALNRQVYEGSLASLIWSEGDAFPGALSQWQQSEVVSTEDSYYFFFNAFGRDSYDGAGITMRTINNNPTISCPNATWNGLTTNYCDGTATDDIIAHEWGHAYTEKTSGLIYAWQAGALNESYSDIWGETVDILNSYGFTPGDNDDSVLRTGCSNSIRWRMGEDSTAFGGAIRDMWDPTCDGHPGKVSDDEYACGAGDAGGGVHSNSGIPNHSYALLVDGGTYNGQTIDAIGMTKAAHIYWRTQSTYLTPVSDFADFGVALQQSCQDLTGLGLAGLTTDATPVGLSGEVITAADCLEVAQAIAATELAVEPTQCSFETVLDPNPPALTCSAGARADDHSEDFSAGLGDYTVGNTPSNPSTWDERNWFVTSPLTVTGRTGQAAFGPDPNVGNCTDDLDNGIVYIDGPVITIPTNNIEPYLEFAHWVYMESTYDGGNLEASVNGRGYALVPAGAYTFNPYNDTLINDNTNNNPLKGQAVFSGNDEGALTSDWGTSHVSIATLGVSGGDTVQFRWQVSTDGCEGGIGWFVDDITVSSCALALTATKAVSPTGTVFVGDMLEYTIDVQNSGDGTATTTITDTFAAGLDHINCNLITGASSVSVPVVAGVLSDMQVLGSGEGAKYVCTAMVSETLCDGSTTSTTLNNSAFASAPEEVGGPVQTTPVSNLIDLAHSSACNPNLVITKTASAMTVFPGDTISYTIAFENLSGYAGEAITLTDVVPADVTILGVVNSGVVITPVVATASLLEWQVAPLLIGGSGMLTLTAQISSNITAETVISNSVMITTSNDTNAIHNVDDAVVSFIEFDLDSLDTVTDEGIRMMLISVTLSADLLVSTTVNYSTSAGTAAVGADYADSSGTLTFGTGNLIQVIEVPIVNDLIDEPDETLSVTLSNINGADSSRSYKAEITIIDDDPAPLINIIGSPILVGESDGSKRVTVSLSGPSALTVAVVMSTTDGTATAGSDYTPISQTISFAPGETVQTAEIPILPDSEEEQDELFSLTLSNPSEGELGSVTELVVTIIDDDDDKPAAPAQIFLPLVMLNAP